MSSELRPADIMRKAALCGVVLVVCASFAMAKPSYPDCILESLKTQPNASDAAIFNATKLCLLKEEQPLSVESFPMASAILVQNSLMGVTVLRVTLQNDTSYTVTSVAVKLFIEGKLYTYQTRSFNAVYHGPGIVSHFGNDFLSQLTIPPKQTREFDILTTFNVPATTKLNWEISEIRGIAT